MRVGLRGLVAKASSRRHPLVRSHPLESARKWRSLAHNIWLAGWAVRIGTRAWSGSSRTTPSGWVSRDPRTERLPVGRRFSTRAARMTIARMSVTACMDRFYFRVVRTKRLSQRCLADGRDASTLGRSERGTTVRVLPQRLPRLLRSERSRSLGSLGRRAGAGNLAGLGEPFAVSPRLLLEEPRRGARRALRGSRRARRCEG